MLKQCKNGKHSLIEIHMEECNYNEVKVTRWCIICGSIVIDLDIDNRIHPGRYMKMKSPEISKKIEN